jgi:hypothetical protein
MGRISFGFWIGTSIRYFGIVNGRPARRDKIKGRKPKKEGKKEIGEKKR